MKVNAREINNYEKEFEREAMIYGMRRKVWERKQKGKKQDDKYQRKRRKRD